MCDKTISKLARGEGTFWDLLHCSPSTGIFLHVSYTSVKLTTAGEQEGQTPCSASGHAV